MISKAKMEELKEIYELYKICSQDLKKQDIYMWDEDYPTIDLIEKEIKADNMFVIKEDNQIIVSFDLSDYLDELWAPVDWQDDNFLGLHLLAVHPDYQRQGYGLKVLKFSEEYALDNNFTSLHLDVLSKNQAALKLYRNNGYKKVGELNFDFKPEGYQKYLCFEKILA